MPWPSFGVRKGPFRSRQVPVFSDAPTIVGVSPNSGNQLGGTAVTIKGTNFILDGTGSNIKVAFDGVAATSVVVVDRQTITCVVPAMPDTGVVDINVSISNTKLAALLGAFTSYVSVVTEVSPNHGTLDGGTIVAIAGYNFVAGSTVTFGGVAATGVVIIDAQHARCVAPNHAVGYVDVAVVEPGGAEAISRGGFQFTLLNRGEDIRRNPGITVQDTLNNSPNTCGFRIDGAAPAPKIGEKIEIHDSFDNNRLLFAGTIQTINQIYEGQTDQIAWDVQCVDFTWLMNRRRPFGTYINQSVSFIVKDLASRFASGFTTVHVQTNLAKITIVFDGRDDLATCFSTMAAMIGGGHWYVDYNMDIHFFHITTNIPIPPSAMPTTDAGHMTVSEGALSGAGQLFDFGYYLFRHTFFYSDGSESTLQSISNVLLCTGKNILSFAGVPIGANPGGGITCIGRRIYYNRFVTGYPGGDSIETVQGFVQINDNTTAAFTTWFGTLGVSDPVNIVALGPVNTLPTPSVATPAGFTLLSNLAAQVLLNGGIDRGTYGIPGLISPPGDPTQLAIPGLQTTVMFPITSSNDGSFSGPTGFEIGDVLTFKCTAMDSQNRETTLGAGPGFVWTLQQDGPYGGSFIIPRLVAPALPAGATLIRTYVSCARVDGGNYHATGSAVAGGVLIGGILGIAVINTSSSAANPGNILNPAQALAQSDVAPTTNTARSLSTAWVGYNGVTELPAAGPFPSSGGVVAYFATAQLATLLENASHNLQVKPPIKQFNGHPAGPTTPAAATIDRSSGHGTGFDVGGTYQFKVAFLYRDGSVSYPGPASPTVTAPLVAGTWTRGFNLSNIPVGPAIGTNDVVARFVYFCIGYSSNSNYSSTSPVVEGSTWPISFQEPDWVVGVSTEVMIVPDNITTAVAQFLDVELGTVLPSSVFYPGAFVGRGNAPYNNTNLQAISVDPIPLWPNPDGPSLEDDDPPNDIDDDNVELLHEDSGSQPFQVFTDLSQVRNRILVFGSGSVLTTTANIGDTQINIGDVSAFSPAGGTSVYLDPSTGDYIQFKYNGIGGVAGAAFITLAKSLQRVIAQGTNISNFLQVDDVESQTFLSKIELDKDGKATDGIHEYVIIDTSLKAAFQLYMRAYAELELFGKPIVTITYATRDPKTRSGQTVHVDLTNPPCQGDFLIQSVTIDQIHDESDDLMPRYTVSASSVKFELNDLLLQILAGTTSANTQSSVAGLTTSAIAQALAQAPAATTGTFVPRPAPGRVVAYSTFSGFSGTVVTTSATGWSNSLGNGTATTAHLLDGPWYKLASSGGVADQTWRDSASTAGWTYIQWQPLVHIRFKMDPTNGVTLLRAWFGLFDAVMPSSDDAHTRKGVGIRYSTFAGDATWVAWTGDGTTQVIGGALLPAATGHIYDVLITVGASSTTIQMTDQTAGTTATVTIANPNLPFTLVSGVPTPSTGIPLSPWLSWNTTDAPGRQFHIAHIYGEHN